MSKKELKKKIDKVSHSETVSVRVDGKILQSIRGITERKNISVSSYINNALHDHVHWHSYASRVGFIPITRTTMFKLMEIISENDLIELAKRIAVQEAEDGMLALGKEFTAKTFLEAYDTWLNIVGFPNTHEVIEGSHRIVIQHNLGKNFAIFVGNILKSILEACKAKKITLFTTPNIIVFECTI